MKELENSVYFLEKRVAELERIIYELQIKIDGQSRYVFKKQFMNFVLKNYKRIKND